MLRNLFVWSAVVVGSSACFTTGAMQPASTLGKGNLTGGVEGTLNLLAVPNAQTARDLGVSQATPYPSVNGIFRVGVTDHVDLGVRAGFTGLELTSKFMFTDPNDRIVLSLAPSVTGYYLPSVSDGTTTTKNTGRFRVPLPLLFGYKIGDHEFVAGARLVPEAVFVRDIFAGAPTQTVFGFSAGGSVGFALRLGNSFILMPEVSVEAPVFLSSATQFGTVTALGLGIVQLTAGVGCMWGRFKPRANAAPVVLPEEEMPPPPMVPPNNPPPQEELPPDVAPPPPPPPMVPAQ